MEERSLRVYSGEKTFFSKLTNTITKLLIPTKVGINGVLISLKRNNVLKNYETFLEEQEEATKKESYEKKFEDAYALYLEAIDKHIMDSIYKKVKNNAADDFEKNALSRYYMVTHLKETEYVEYKYRKQKYLLELDYQTVKTINKQKILQKYNSFYLYKMESLYKGLLKHYSIKLADNLSLGDKDEIYQKIFQTLEEYIGNILPLKIEKEQSKIYKEIAKEYENFDRFTVGKLDQNDHIEKNIILLGISRKLFTHSLPLIVAEQCYQKLMRDIRSLIVDTRIIKKQEKAYSLLIDIIEEYKIKLLSTKIYWDKPAIREEYKEFLKEYKKIENEKEKNVDEYEKQKEILFLKNELKEVLKEELKYDKIIKFYKTKLVEFGVMKVLHNTYSSQGSYKKVITKNKIKV